MTTVADQPIPPGHEALYADAVSLRVNGLNLQKQGDFAQALAAFLRSAAMFRRAQAAVQVGWTLQNQGLVLEQLDLPAAALVCFDEAEAVFLAHAELSGIPLMYRRRGDLHRHQGNQVEAQAEYAEGLRRYRADHIANGVINTLSSIAASHLASGDVTAAKAALNEALIQLQSYPRRSGEFDFLLLARLAQTEQLLGNTAVAKRFADDADELARSLDLVNDRSNPDVMAFLAPARK